MFPNGRRKETIEVNVRVRSKCRKHEAIERLERRKTKEM